MKLIVFVFHLLVLKFCTPCYKRIGENLQVVPHIDDISFSCIRLDDNKIREIQANAFSRFENLAHLSLKDNEIHTIDSLAFEGTKIGKLFLNNNKLTSMPDVTSLSGSLYKLVLSANQIVSLHPSLSSLLNERLILYMENSNYFNTWPAFTSYERDIELYISEAFTLPVSIPEHVCGIEVLEWNEDDRELPSLDCSHHAEPKLDTLKLRRWSMIDYSQFDRIIVPSMYRMSLTEDNLSRIPALPQETKQNLAILKMQNNELEFIRKTDLEAFSSLLYLNVEENPLRQIETEVYLMPGIHLDISNLVNEHGFHEIASKWKTDLCFDSNITRVSHITLSGNLKSISQFPIIPETLCRSQVNFTILQTPVPCDCSIMGFVDMVVKCDIHIATDNIPCSKSSWELVKSHLITRHECPDAFLMTFTKVGFGGTKNLFRTEVDFGLVSKDKIESIFIYGQDIWTIEYEDGRLADVLQGAIDNAQLMLTDVATIRNKEHNGEYKLLLYPAPVRRFGNTCESEHYNYQFLMDANLTRCLSLTNAKQTFLIYSRVPKQTPNPFNLTVSTDNIDCTNVFNVLPLVSLIKPNFLCNTMCELSSYTVNYPSHQCTFRCGSYGTLIANQVYVRFAVIGEGFICGLNVTNN